MTTAAQPRSRRLTFRSSVLGYLTIGPVVVLLLALLLFPIVRLVIYSVYDIEPARGIDEYIGLRGFRELLGDDEFWRVTINSLKWTIAVVIGQSALGMTAAVLVNRAFPGRWLVRAMIILPWAVPGVVAAMVWRLIYNPQIGSLQILTGYLGMEPSDILGRPSTALFGVMIAAIWKGFPFWMLLALAALQSVPKDQVEAAAIDGAGVFQQARYVYLPSMAPVLKVGYILTAIWTFNYFEMVYVMTGGGPVRSSHILPTIIYDAAFRRLNPGDAARYAVVSILILSVLALLFVRESRRQDTL